MATRKGTKGSDNLIGTTGKDTITSLAGNDTLSGLAGDDTLNAGAGDDILTGGAGKDILIGGTGADTFKYTSFNDSKGGSAFGIDTIKDFNASAGDKVDLTDLGTATLKSLRDASFTGLQAVFAYNAATNQTTLSYYNTGSSTPVFQVKFAGNVSYSETAFLGIVNPTAPPPVPPSISVADASASEGDNLTFAVTRAGDLSNPSTVAYTLSDGTTGSVSFAANEGSKNIVVSTTEDNVVGNSGSITVTLSNPANATISDGTATGTINDDDAPTEGADNLVGTSGNNTIDLLGGNDTYDGLAGNDTINGGAGDDTLSGGDGDDTVIFSAGYDLYDGGEGFDTIDFSRAQTGVRGVQAVPSGSGLFNLGVSDDDALTFSNVERVLGSGFDDTINLSALATPITIDGGAGADQIIGGSGNASLLGGAGNDSLHGGSGNDTLDGGADDDTITGGAGTDTINGDTGNDSLNGEDGDDYMTAGDGDDTFFFSYGRDFALGGAGTDTIDLSSLSLGVQTITDQTGADTILIVYGTQGTLGYTFIYEIENIIATDFSDQLDMHRLGNAVTISGGNGDDTIVGSQFADNLNGEAGSDTIYGLDGADVLTGGSGNDAFAYTSISESTSTTRDKIQDFLAGGDKIDLSRLDANSSTPLGDDVFSFIGSNAFSNTAGELRFEGADSAWLVQADINGDGVSDFEIIVVPVTGFELVSTDFIL